MNISQESYKLFLASLLAGDRQQCYNIVNTHWENENSLLNLYEELLKKAMYEIGNLWEVNQISVAAEHLASGIIESILNDLQTKLKNSPNSNNRILSGCVENEYHQIGIKMISDVFEKNGWKSYFLGANIPTKELLQFAKIIQPQLFALSLSIYSHLPDLEEMIIQIRSVFPQIKIVVGGQAFRHGGVKTIEKYENIVLLKDTYQTEEFIKTFDL